MKVPRLSFRRPAPRANLWWRFFYPAVLAGLVGVAFWAANTGRDQALKIKDGRPLVAETDPTKPNFVAQVTPTTVRTLVQLGGEGRQLVGVTVVSLAADGRGGSLLQLAAETRAPDGRPLWRVWEQAAHPPLNGAPSTTAALPAGGEASAAVAVNAALARMLDVGLPEPPIVLTLEQLAATMRTALPFAFKVDERVLRAGPDGRSISTAFNAGIHNVKKESEIVELFELITFGESPQKRLSRQASLFKTWLDAAVAVKATWPPETDPRLVPFLDAFAAGPVVHQRAPIAEEVLIEGLLIDIPDADKLRAIALEMVPLPVSIDPGHRLRIAVYNGTAERDLALAATPRLVAAGAQIDRIGNAASFDVARSEVRYFHPDLRARAESFARAIGIDRVSFEDHENAFDVTVTLGADFR